MTILITEYHVEHNQWEELRVEFSISAVKTKSLRAKVEPKTWNHHCITYHQERHKKHVSQVYDRLN